MSKAIMISIKPKYVAKTLNGEKTKEIRTTCPKQLRGDTPVKPEPIDVYIYCTKEEKLYDDYPNMANGRFKHNKVFKGEENMSGKVVAKFTLNKVEKIKQYVGVFWRCGGHPYYTDSVDEYELLNRSCLSVTELENYLKGKIGYAWHIDNLVIFDKPKELSEFYKVGHHEDLDDYCTDEKWINGKWCIPLTKAPQSWCYVEVDYE